MRRRADFRRLSVFRHGGRRRGAGGGTGVVIPAERLPFQIENRRRGRSRPARRRSSGGILREFGGPFGFQCAIEAGDQVGPPLRHTERGLFEDGIRPDVFRFRPDGKRFRIPRIGKGDRLFGRTEP